MNDLSPSDKRGMIVIGIIVAVIALWLMTIIICSIVKAIRNRIAYRTAHAAAQERYAAIVKISNKLSRQLSELLTSGDDPVELIVQFFALTSPVSDTAFSDFHNFGRYLTDDQNRNLHRICSIIGNMGRCNYGWNRTEAGQPVTAYDVYLGNIYGIWTNSVSYWKERRPNLTGLHANTYQILQHQAKHFMEANTGALKKALARC